MIHQYQKNFLYEIYMYAKPASVIDYTIAVIGWSFIAFRRSAN